jgi:hypothetical protein
MNDYEIGKDVQDLRARLEQLEAGLNGRSEQNFKAGRGASAHHGVSGGLSDAPPEHWKLEGKERIPPFAASLLRLPFPLPSRFDAPPQSRTWGCTPEPLIMTVFWSGGGTDEFFRLVNQTFSIFKWTNPNTGKVIATATYAATLVGAGRAHTQFNSTNFMEVTVRAARGTPLQVIGKNFSVACNENSLFIISAEIDPGQFDLIGGATWSNTFNFIQPC